MEQKALDALGGTAQYSSLLDFQLLEFFSLYTLRI